MKDGEYQIGNVNEEGAICINKRGPVELWSTSNGEYFVYFHIDKAVFLYNKRDYREEAECLFNATLRMAKKR